ncbi:SDR family oxidoreductase, partial [Corynebacterium heidelbergense]
MEIYITGAHGQVGRELARQARAGGHRVHALGRQDLDLRALTEDPFTSTNRAVILNAAAYTDVDGAEDPARAEEVWQVNAEAPGALAQFAQRRGWPLIHLSTDYVHGGRTGPEVHRIPEGPIEPADRPINAYGRSKLAGEEAVMQAGGVVVRTSWVYSGPHQPGRDFVVTMLQLAQRGVDPKVVADQWGLPTYAADLAGGLLQLAERLAADGPQGGILHAAGSGEPVSWYHFARAVFAAGGQDPDRVSPIPTAEY